MLTLLKDTYNEIYLLKYGWEYAFQNKRVEKSLRKFIKKIPPTAGQEWFNSYIIFQFAHYSTMKTRFNGHVFTNWIFGEQALKRWNDRTPQQIYFADKYKAELGVKKEFEAVESNPYFESERSRFDDMSRRLIHCHELELYDDKSKTCKECQCNEICKLNKGE